MKKSLATILTTPLLLSQIACSDYSYQQIQDNNTVPFAQESQDEPNLDQTLDCPYQDTKVIPPFPDTCIDVLITLDTSGSMREEYQKTVSWIEKFSRETLPEYSNAQLIITSTNPLDIQSTQDPIDAQSEDIVELTENQIQNINYSDIEKPFETTLHLLLAEDQAWLRDDCKLYLIHISDEDDQSFNYLDDETNADQLAADELFYQIPDEQFETGMFYTAIAVTDQSTQDYGNRFKILSDLLSSSVQDISDEPEHWQTPEIDFGTPGANYNSVELSYIPVEESLIVKIQMGENEPSLTQDFDYDSQTNTIDLWYGENLNIDDQIQISYQIDLEKMNQDCPTTLNPNYKEATNIY